MSTIVLDTTLTDAGVECTHPVLGKVATITRTFAPGKIAGMPDYPAGVWTVIPYRFPPYERGAWFHSMSAAEFYAVALAHEMHETGNHPKDGQP